jgi:hypothetical protein
MTGARAWGHPGDQKPPGHSAGRSVRLGSIWNDRSECGYTRNSRKPTLRASASSLTGTVAFNKGALGLCDAGRLSERTYLSPPQRMIHPGSACPCPRQPYGSQRPLPLISTECHCWFAPFSLARSIHKTGGGGFQD